MIIQFENTQLKLEEILNDDFNLTNFNGIEFSVLSLICKWFSHQPTFTFKTSGSTGKSKEIEIERTKIEYSTLATYHAIDPSNKITSSILCLDSRFIGGAMVVFRALIMKHDLLVLEPSSTPLEKLNDHDQFGIISMVPMQYLKSSPDKINRVSNILIGGGSIDVIDNPNIKSNVYSTFGMTETVSHVALRKIDHDVFTTTGDAKVSINDDESLCVSGTITGHKTLHTNDIVDLVSETQFKWIGRKDFIINSGGIKLNPEALEAKLSNQFGTLFFVSSLPDPHLGNKLILIFEGDELPPIDYSPLEKYEIPKQLYSIKKIPLTESGKIDRIKSRKLIIDLATINQ